MVCVRLPFKATMPHGKRGKQPRSSQESGCRLSELDFTSDPLIAGRKLTNSGESQELQDRMRQVGF